MKVFAEVVQLLTTNIAATDCKIAINEVLTFENRSLIRLSGGNVMIKSRFALLAMASVATMFAASQAQAGGTITNGNYTVGISDNGQLFDGNAYVGFRRGADGYDPLSPGTPRDSWGVSTNLGGAWGDDTTYGSNGILSTSLTLAGASATNVITTNVGVTLSENFSFAADNILRISHTITNTSGGDLDVSFQREWDTDIDPTFSNESFSVGADGRVTDSSWYGFDFPVGGYGSNTCNAGCDVTGDNGGGIRIGLGTLGAGQSISFIYLYGISQQGQNVNQLIAQAQGVGATYMIAGQGIENGNRPGLGANSAFIAVARDAVPEPASWAMMVAGFGLAGAAMRRRRTQTVFA